jgi:hypothetical protein
VDDESTRDTLPDIPVDPEAPYSEKLSLTSVPFIAIPREQLLALPLDARHGFVLSLIDGDCTLEDVIDISGFDRADTIEILTDLLRRGVILLKRRPVASQSAG